MKPIVIAAVAALLLPAAGLAQVLTPTERVAAARAAGFRAQGLRIVNECDAVAENIAFERRDLNGDGVSELVVSDSSACYGASGSTFAVLRRVNGQWKPVLAAQGVMTVLKTRHGGWADIEIGGPGFGKMPVARWSGQQYDY